MIVNDMQGLDSVSKIMKIIIPNFRKHNAFSPVRLVSDLIPKLWEKALHDGMGYVEKHDSC